jgi:hypothetical protein
MAKPEDLTKTAAWRQMSAMGCRVLEVGVRNGDRGLMMRRQWTPSEALHFLPWLKARNARGADIYIQPAPDLLHGLVLVDDLSRQAIAKLVADGLTPACTVETSRANFQVWVKIAPVVLPALRTVIARRLARDYGGDPASVGAGHFGRLAGFTNCKPQRVDADGRRSFVLCRTWDGAVAPAGVQMLAWAVRQQDSLSPAPAGRAACGARWPVGASATGDQSRADFARACGLARAGRGLAEIAAVLAAESPRIAERKRGHIGNYCRRTAEAAMRAVTAARRA